MISGIFGAIVGDIVGSVYEFNNLKSKDFEFFDNRAFFTDDTVMTVAIGTALIQCNGDYKNLSELTIKAMQSLGPRYPDAGYGWHFGQWLCSNNPKPYNSWGNGAAMRVSAVAYFAKSLEEVKELSEKVTAVSHNHPEGIKGAEATAVAVYLALHGKNKEEIKEYITQNYYSFNFTLDEIRPTYKFEVSCQESVPQALEAFFEAVDFEDAIRNAISIGGDSDTIGAICGAVAGAYYGVPEKIRQFALNKLDDNLRQNLAEIEEACSSNDD